MRFAAAHFGQRNAGSPLNAFMRTVLRFLASRQAPPARRSAFTKRAASPTEGAAPALRRNRPQPRPSPPQPSLPPSAPQRWHLTCRPHLAGASALRPCTARSGWMTPLSSPRHPSTPGAQASLASAPSARQLNAAPLATSTIGIAWLPNWVSASAPRSVNSQPSVQSTLAWSSTHF